MNRKIYFKQHSECFSYRHSISSQQFGECTNSILPSLPRKVVKPWRSGVASASRRWLTRLMLKAQESRQTQQFGLSNAMACIRSAALRLQLLFKPPTWKHCLAWPIEGIKVWIWGKVGCRMLREYWTLKCDMAVLYSVLASSFHSQGPANISKLAPRKHPITSCKITPFCRKERIYIRVLWTGEGSLTKGKVPKYWGHCSWPDNSVLYCRHP